MALNNARKGPGGTGFQGEGPDSAAAALIELQGLNIDILTGATADTKIDVAAIRSEDTILAAHEQDGTSGLLVDITGNMSINTLYATGTLTAATIIAGSECGVAGQTYTFQAGAPITYGQVEVGADDSGSIANLKAAINAYETSIERGGAQVVATNATNVCTVTAAAEGAAGNAITLTTVDATIVVSGAVLAGGSDTGGVQSSSDTSADSIVLYWYNKS